ncbi:DUF4998 domain-containing protein [Proteiniphilum sp.]|uniref:DUF4998 domain-containing protein n=1 Tax=Proteiniphilum sp. TaxID=1926877 RepID=UPI002B1EA0F8|nr:DUF4998 domain-containing protein [Proteiniphilum sp.]MEA4916862.1 DUF4998 domain-containing protein [Proteiniphilum sp.]
MRKLIILSVFIVMLYNCSDINDTHQDFLDRGERIYVGRADTLVVLGGYERARIQGMMYYANSAEKCIIRWTTEGKKDSVVVQAAEWKANNDTLSVLIEGLTEGTQRFFVQTYDKEGNKSLNLECSGTIYGEQYILSATPKFITQMKPLPEGMQLTWSMSEEAVGVEVKHETNGGETYTKVDAKAATTLLPDWKLSGEIQTRTIFLPEGAIDTLYAAWSAPLEFPDFVEFSVDKTRIKHVPWGQYATTGYDGAYTGVFDGIFRGGGNQFHSGDRAGVPQHLMFDLNVVTNLTRFETYARDDSYHNWNPKKIQIWGIEVLNESSEVKLSSMDPGWEDEARAKGWKLLTENTCNDPISNKLTITNPQKVRYIILRTTEVYGPPSSGSGAYVILREVTLFADSILPAE